MGTIEPHVFVELYAGEGDPEYFNEEEHTQVTNGCHRGLWDKPGHYEGVPAYSSVAVASSGFPISRQLRNLQFNKRRRDMLYIPWENYVYYLIWRPLPDQRQFPLIEAILASFKKASFTTGARKSATWPGLVTKRGKLSRIRGLKNILVVNFRLKSYLIHSNFTSCYKIHVVHSMLDHQICFLNWILGILDQTKDV